MSSKGRKSKRSKQNAEDTSAVEEEEIQQGSLTCKECGTVFTDDDDQVLQCERCDYWFCLPCTRPIITPEHYVLLNSEVGAAIHWYCHHCNENAVRAVKTDNEIEERCKMYMASVRTDITNEIKMATQEVDTRLSTRMDKIDDEIKKIKEVPPAKSTKAEQLSAEELIDELPF